MNLEGFFVVLTWFENVLFKLTRKSFEMKTGCLQLWGSGCHDNISWRISNISGQKVSMTEQKLFSDLCCDAVYGHSSSFRCSVILKWKPWRPHRQILSLERSLWPLIGWQGVTGVWDEGVGLSGGWWWVFLSMYGKVQGVGFNHGGGCCWIPEKAEEQERAEAGSSWSPDMPPSPLLSTYLPQHSIVSIARLCAAISMFHLGSLSCPFCLSGFLSPTFASLLCRRLFLNDCTWITFSDARKKSIEWRGVVTDSFPGRQSPGMRSTAEKTCICLVRHSTQTCCDKNGGSWEGRIHCGVHWFALCLPFPP